MSDFREFVPKADPEMRADNKCAVCRRVRKPPATNYGREDWYRDPFCSSSCARKWHGTTVALGQQGGKPGTRVS